MQTLAAWVGMLALVYGLTWMISRISMKRGEDRIAGKILGKQQKAARNRKRSLRERTRLRGEPLRKRLRELAGRG